MNDRKIKQVFEFSPNEADFWPTQEFKSDLAASQCPFIIMFAGNSKAGKSTRLNQLITHELTSEGPFEADSRVEAVTQRFQYTGPFKSLDLAEVHSLDIQVESNPDLFLIDCERLHSLGNTTPVLKQATFALSQMVSMRVLVMKEQLIMLFVCSESCAQSSTSRIFDWDDYYDAGYWNSISTRTETEFG
jgi:GTPase SAR1 family protein